MDTSDQAFLNAELQNAVASGEEDELKLVLLQYHQAMLQALQAYVPLCETDKKRDFSLLKRRVTKLLLTTENYINTVAMVPIQSVQQNVVAESKTLFADVGQLCQECQQSIQQSILATFRKIRSG